MNKKSGGLVLALAGLVMMAAFPLAAAAKEKSSQTFEGGRRVYLRHGDWETVTWNVNEAPNGKELIFNAYDGEVLLRKVRVKY